MANSNTTRRMACAAEWQAECVNTLLRTNPKALLAVSAFPGVTQYQLPFDITKLDDEYIARIQCDEETFEGSGKTRKLAEQAAAQSACLELERRGNLHDPSLFLGCSVNPKQTLMNSGLYSGKTLPLTTTVSGPGHAKVFVAEMLLPLGDSEPYLAVGKASSKSEAEKMCCLLACQKLLEVSLVLNRPGINNMASFIHQQNELPTVIEIENDALARLEEALRKLESRKLDVEPLRTPARADRSAVDEADSGAPAEGVVQQNDILKESAGSNSERLSRIEFRKVLPIWSDREKILQAVEDNRVIVLTGDTGSGKSTQVPQFILEDAESKGFGGEVNIVVTQPRRIAAMSLSERVAWERGEALGNSVGYTIRLDNVAPRAYGSILFCTAGVLLCRLQANELKNLSHIIIDEAHERDIATDCLLTVVRDLLTSRTVKVIIMSATLDASIFTSYFNNCPHISIPGKSYPVKVYFREEFEQLMGLQESFADDTYSDPDCVFAASVIEWISESFAQDNGAVLCFLPGWAAIVAVKENLLKTKAAKSLEIVPFHSQLSAREQRLAFLHAPEGKRKVVLSTNIAETSVTIDDVVYVVDSGKMKEKHFKPSRNMAVLKMQWISRACSLQRKGRAGRVRAGFCFRLYCKSTFSNMLENRRPEMQRMPLEELCLQIKALVVPNQTAFTYQDISTFLMKTIEPPSGSAILAGVNTLKRLGAIDEQENLTSLGRVLTKLPVDPRYGKAMVCGALLGCGELITVAASACFKDPSDYSADQKDEAKHVKAGFASGRAFASDQLSIASMVDRFIAADTRGEGNAFCEKHFLSPVIMRLIKGMRRQFLDTLENEKILPVGCEDELGSDMDVSRCLLVSGLAPNIARTAMCRDSKGSKRISHRWRLGFCVQAGRVLCHPLSVLDERALNPQKHYYMVFEEKVRSTQAFIRGCDLVPPLALVVFCGCVRERRELASRPGWTVLQVESWLDLHVEVRAAQVLMKLRGAIDTVVHRWIEWPARDESEMEVVNLLKQLLKEETSRMLCV